MSTIPGAVVVARDYLLLPSDSWRMQCSCESCLASLTRSLDSEEFVFDPTIVVGPEKDPAITVEIPPVKG